MDWNLYNRLQPAAAQNEPQNLQWAFQPSSSSGTVNYPNLLAQQLRDAAESQITMANLAPSLVQAATASKESQLHQQALANLNMRESDKNRTQNISQHHQYVNGNGIEIKTSQPIFPGQVQQVQQQVQIQPQPPPRQSSQVSQSSSSRSNRTAFPGQAPPTYRVVPSPSPNQHHVLSQPGHVQVNHQYYNPSPSPSPAQHQPQTISAYLLQQQQQQQQEQQQQYQQQQLLQQQQQQLLQQQQEQQRRQREEEEKQRREEKERRERREREKREQREREERARRERELREQREREARERAERERQERERIERERIERERQERERQERERQQREKEARERERQRQIQQQQQLLQQQQQQQLLAQQQRQQQEQLQLQQQQAALQQQQFQQQQQDLGLARLGALADLSDVAGLTNEIEQNAAAGNTINYDDVNLSQINPMLSFTAAKNSPAKANSNNHWLNRASELLDLSSGDSRDSGQVHNQEELQYQLQQQQLQQQQQQQLQQLQQHQQQLNVINPWDPNSALATTMQAYHAGLQLMQQQTQEDQRPRVICVAPDEEFGWLMNLPAPCNIVLQPSEIGMSGKPPDSQYAVIYSKFLKGEVVKPAPEKPKDPEPKPGDPLPGKKAYIPPYTPKSALRPSGGPTPHASSFGRGKSSNTFNKGPGANNQFQNRNTSSTNSSGRPTAAEQAAAVAAAARAREQAQLRMKQAQHSQNTQQGNNGSSSSGGMTAYQQQQAAKRARIQQEMSEEDQFAADMAVMPKREKSSRGAAKRATQKYQALNQQMDDDEDELPGLDLSDSDEDASWTPFKDKDPAMTTPDLLGGGGGGNRQMSNNPYLNNQQTGGSSQNQQSLQGNQTSGNSFNNAKSKLPAPTMIVQDGKPFSIGDFMVLKSDVERDSAPIWRLDSKTLLQRYNPIEGETAGKWYHRSANLFSGYSAVNRLNYISVSVKFISAEKGENTVKVLQKGAKGVGGGAGSGNNGASNYPMADPAMRKRSLNETAQFQEPFEVYIQALISQCLDSNFLQEVFTDQDDYFVSNIEKVDSVAMLRKDKIKISWIRRFQTAIDTWPCLNDLGSAAVQGNRCGACDSDRPVTMVQMFGQPYNANTLKTVAPSEDASMNRNFSVCKRCSRLASLYHKLHHLKHRMFNVCADIVETRRRQQPYMETTKILNDLLASESWLEQQFRSMQDLWADADTFVR